MAELKAVGLVSFKESENQTEEREIKLNHEFDRFISDEFEELRQEFEPTDNSEFIKDYCKRYKIYLGPNLPPCNRTRATY